MLIANALRVTQKSRRLRGSRDLRVVKILYHFSATKPYSQGDRERYVALATLLPPIIFHTGIYPSETC
ncbi:hypothetical protein HYDPIDRAFT_119775 [Hydnomerulius pinastri MD-312]|uniref:Unplaced genomic scaffold scaffold_132, whole genome shotgun sequence n=1 Tax=Hydnomerulius pinastri MD-312 TaxID=994086 RepID=A0A0C9VKZ5_9AGAM|nr:hypothetical protein HYDPIDRAFT_119775 [Hydnomerulius pinastri MD-312]